MSTNRISSDTADKRCAFFVLCQGWALFDAYEREADREKETILAFVEGYYQDNPGITFDDAINFVASILRKDDSYIRQMIG